MPSHADLARSFDAAADVYARARPSYPDAAVDWVLPPGARDVLDLGAGTGKLTVQLADRGLAVTAVEPSDRMRGRLQQALGDRVSSLAGSAEQIPLPDACLDAVLVGQAWHWVDPARACPEVARVLRPGGWLGLLWNRRDTRVDWVAQLSEILHQEEDRLSASNPGITAPFGPSQRFDTAPWSQSLTADGLVELAASRSYVITLPEPERKSLLGRVRELATGHPALAGHGEIALPYFTECVRAELPAG